MTKPGEQFMARRRAFARIKELFDENGISLATPTVNVGEGGTGAAAHLVQHEAAKAAASGG
jgi:moderate conductance mechanosensitive channel